MSIAKYIRVKQYLLEKIISGEYKPGDKIMSENEIKDLFSVSSTTAVKALQELTFEGYLVRKQGEGTFVRKSFNGRTVTFTEIAPFIQSSSAQTKEYTKNYIVEKLTNTKLTKRIVKKYATASLIRIIQFAYVNNELWKIQDRYIPETNLDSKQLENIKNGSSVSKALNLEDNIINYNMEMEVFFTKFDQEDFDYFVEINSDVKKMESILVKTERAALDSSKELIEYDVSYISPKYYKLVIESN